jgi:cell division septation protein DedD
LTALNMGRGSIAMMAGCVLLLGLLFFLLGLMIAGKFAGAAATLPAAVAAPAATQAAGSGGALGGLEKSKFGKKALKTVQFGAINAVRKQAKRPLGMFAKVAGNKLGALGGMVPGANELGVNQFIGREVVDASDAAVRGKVDQTADSAQRGGPRRVAAADPTVPSAPAAAAPAPAAAVPGAAGAPAANDAGASPAAAGAAMPSPASVAAGAPAAPGAAPPAAQAAAPPGPAKPTIPVVQAVAAGAKEGPVYSIDLATFRSGDDAEMFAVEMQRRGYPVEIAEETDRSGRVWRHIRTGRFADADLAGARLHDIERQESITGIIVIAPPAKAAAAGGAGDGR